MGNPLFRTKSIEQILADSDAPEHRLKRSLTAWDPTGSALAPLSAPAFSFSSARQSSEMLTAPEQDPASSCRSFSPASPAHWPPSVMPNSRR